MEKEIWKTIENFEGYKVSNFGRVKRLAKTIKVKNDRGIHLKHMPAIYAQGSLRSGYLLVCLTNEKKTSSHSIHILVGKAFLNYVPNKGVICLDHKDNDKLNNKATNLQILTYRENTIKYQSQFVNDSDYTGVTKSGSNIKPWRVQVRSKGVKYNLGNYKTQEEASQVYQNFINNLE